MLVASLGGTTWAWGSAQTVLVAVAGRRRCWRASSSSSAARANRCCRSSLLSDEVFRVAALLSLIVGFALFGSVTFLPLFFQTVFHASPTARGCG